LRFLDRGVDASAGGDHGVIGAFDDDDAGTGGGEGVSDARPHPSAAVDADGLGHPRGSGGGLAHDLSPFVSGPVLRRPPVLRRLPVLRRPPVLCRPRPVPPLLRRPVRRPVRRLSSPSSLPVWTGTRPCGRISPAIRTALPGPHYQ